MCPTICDGASVNRATCDNPHTCTPQNLDCNDGTISLTAGRDVCSVGAAGETQDVRATGFDGVSGEVSLTYAPACAAADHSVIFGPLQDVSTYGYSGESCAIGTSGSFDLALPGTGSFFFLVVGEGATGDEGSYGTSSDPAERPPHPMCAGAQGFDGDLRVKAVGRARPVSPYRSQKSALRMPSFFGSKV